MKKVMIALLLLNFTFTGCSFYQNDSSDEPSTIEFVNVVPSSGYTLKENNTISILVSCKVANFDSEKYHYYIWVEIKAIDTIDYPGTTYSFTHKDVSEKEGMVYLEGVYNQYWIDRGDLIYPYILTLTLFRQGLIDSSDYSRLATTINDPIIYY